MSEVPLKSRWLSLPIAAQILGLLLGGLVAAQIATLVLTVLLPPKPPEQHGLAEIAGALRGGPLGEGARPLVRATDTLPPSAQSPGWQASARSTADLAVLLHVPETDVRLLFYAPPPFAGSAPRLHAEAVTPGFDRSMLIRAAFDDQGGPPGPPGGGPGGFPGNAGPGGPSVFRPGDFPDRGQPSQSAPARRPAPTGDRGPASSPSMGPGSPTPGGRAPPNGAGPGARSAPGPGGPAGPRGGFTPRSPLDAAVFAPAIRNVVPQTAPEPVAEAPAPKTESPEVPPVARAAKPLSEATLQQSPSLAATSAAPATSLDNAARTLAPPKAQTLFGFKTTPQVEGEFVAALRLGPDQWITVRPKPESFPNSWQRRVLLWFLVAFAGVAPVGYLFARRLAAPLQDFARAAERLGRDPLAAVVATDGPAEVGRAARAFNLMQLRLRRYIDDRTGMIGAISHDLRTPLARMRFRLERAPPALKAAMSRDIAQMEEMISSVLIFMRDDATGGRRERVDLRSVLEVVVDDACAAGGEVELQIGEPLEAEVDLLAMQRVFENLVSNATKYGERARLSMRARDGELVVEVADTGPGLPDEELERVFKPFYRGPAALALAQSGIGLGLAVSRSTVRAHGGDLTLRRAAIGLVAEVRLPLAFAAGKAA